MFGKKKCTQKFEQNLRRCIFYEKNKKGKNKIPARIQMFCYNGYARKRVSFLFVSARASNVKVKNINFFMG